MYLYIFIGLIILIILSVRQKKPQGNLHEHLETCQYGQRSATAKGNTFFTNSMWSSFFQRDQALNQLEDNNVKTRKQLDDYKTNVLRSNSEYANLESQYNTFNNNMDNEFRKLHNQLENNKEKAKQSKQSASAKFNSIDNKMNLMVGSPGDDLQSKLKPFVDTAIQTNLNKLANAAIEDVEKQPGLRNRWTAQSGSGNIHNWQIIPGLGCPMRVDPESGNVQCLSYDGANCEWNYVSQHGQDLTKIDTSRVNPLSCGDDHRGKYGSDGYSTGNHWCRTVYNALSKNLTEVDWNMCPVGWTRNNATGTSCNAPSDYSGPCARTSGFAGYSDQGKQGWAQSCLARWPFKVNVNSAVSSMTNMNSEINKNVQGKLGNLVPKSNLNTLVAYNNGVYVKAFKLNTSNNSRGGYVIDGLITTNINFNWGVGLIFGIRENPGITNTDAIYMELIGFIVAPAGASSLKFRLTSDDGSRFFMADNGEISGMKLLIDMWQNGNTQRESSSVNVRANTFMPFVVQYYEKDGSANLRLEWSVNNAAYTVIPREAFFINKEICNHQFNFDYIGQANSRAESVIPRVAPLIPIFDRNLNEANTSEGIYKVYIYRAYTYPCYNITTSSYINGGGYGSVFDNNETTGVDMESYAHIGSTGLPYRIVVFMPVHKTFRGKLRMNLVTPWAHCLPRTMTLNTMSVDQNTYNSYVGNIYAQNIIFNEPNIDSSFNNRINLGQIGDQNQVNRNRINQTWDLNITEPFNIVVFEITSHWGSYGRGGSNSVWITDIRFDTVEAPIVQPSPSNSGLQLVKSKGWLNWNGNPQLLFKATRDGWSPAQFNYRAGNRGATITIATLTDGRIVGGFNPLSWTASGQYRNAPTSFLFDNNDKYTTNNGSVFGSGNAIYDGPYHTYGPTFGGGHDFLSLYSGYGMQTVRGSVYTFQNNQGRGPLGTGRTGSWSASIRELEVYLIPNPVIERVIVYEHANFQGRNLTLGVGTYDYNFINSRGFNDQISSLRVPNGLEVEAWEHNPGGGRRWIFRSDTSWVGNANDTISSLIIRRI